MATKKRNIKKIINKSKLKKLKPNIKTKHTKTQTKHKSKSKSSRRKPQPTTDVSESNNTVNNKGFKTNKWDWLRYNFWDMMFGPYLIKHNYTDSDGYIFAQLIIYKKPVDNMRGFIQFHIKGHLTLDRLDRQDETAVERIYVNKGDKIVFMVDDSSSEEVTTIDYVPFFEQESDENVDYVVSSKILTDVQNIFSWLKYTADPNYFKEILTRVEITKGIGLKDKEGLQLNNIN
jgi:hypothetical protein